MIGEYSQEESESGSEEISKDESYIDLTGQMEECMIDENMMVAKIREMQSRHLHINHRD